MTQAYKKCHLSKQDWHSDDFGSRSPVIKKTFLAEMCYLYRRKRLNALTPYGINISLRIINIENKKHVSLTTTGSHDNQNVGWTPKAHNPPTFTNHIGF